MKRTTPTNPQPPDLHARAMLVSLKVSKWTARKHDAQISEDVARQHNATSSDVGRYNKILLPRNADAKSFHDLMTVAGAARLYHYDQTLAWDAGYRLLPTANYFQYTDGMRKAKSAFIDALDTFIADYPRLLKQAKTRLNGMYLDSDFPDVSQLHSKFSFDLDFAPLPSKGDFRLNLPSAEIAAIESTVEDRIKQSAAEAMRDAWSRLYDTVSHIHERLTKPDGVFRDSLIGNARQLCSVLQRLNFADDVQLEAMRARVEHDLTQFEAADLRNMPEVRSNIANEAEAIMNQMKGLYGGAQ